MMDHIFSIGFRSGEHAGQSISLDSKNNDRLQIDKRRLVRARYPAYRPDVGVRLEAFVAPMAQSCVSVIFSSFHC